MGVGGLGRVGRCGERQRPVIPELVRAGVPGFKCFLIHSGVDGFAWVGEEDLRAAFERLRGSGLPLPAHAEVAGPVEDATTRLNAERRDWRAYSTYLASRTDAAVIEKPYEPESGAGVPHVIVGSEDDITAVALMDDDALRVRNLMPDGPAYDFAVNTMTYDPGAALGMVEIHVMEHGLLMLEGSGIYKLGDFWCPVEAGDFIWMAPYCPQWFGALGKRPAKYLIYKDWRRHPLGA